ncbi:hypothetical protein K440DRAFT_632869 [Wilcoxina mikolae CBS 423.85]|nr:hypothetical protein K440DRAFT_632869 [Wilcoxina mikolae CBS 423.85]
MKLSVKNIRKISVDASTPDLRVAHNSRLLRHSHTLPLLATPTHGHPGPPSASGITPHHSGIPSPMPRCVGLTSYLIQVKLNTVLSTMV